MLVGRGAMREDEWHFRYADRELRYHNFPLRRNSLRIALSA
jgi:hypothetical protein